MSTWEVFKFIVEVVGTSATIWIAWLVYTAQKQKDKEDKTLQKPVLHVVNMLNVGWVLLNVGNGPALNIRFADKSKSGWEQGIIGYTIPPNTYLILGSHIKHAAAISAVYNDLLSNEYLVICLCDTTTVWERGDKGFDETLYSHLHSGPARSNTLLLKNL